MGKSQEMDPSHCPDFNRDAASRLPVDGQRELPHSSAQGKKCKDKPDSRRD